MQSCSKQSWIGCDRKAALLRLRQRFTRWFCGTRLCLLTTVVVLVINLILTGFAIHSKGSGGAGLRQILYEGDCDTVNSLNTGAHVLISILSTTLLTSSNYCMQYLSAPTRRDIERAHARNDWLDVGIMSVRNLKSIPWGRTVLWGLLGVFSLPQHLFYNSAIFATKMGIEYNAILANRDFIKLNTTSSSTNRAGEEKFLSEAQNSTMPLSVYTESLRLSNMYRNGGPVKLLNSSDCIKAYAATYQTGHGSVLVIQDNHGTGDFDDIKNYDQGMTPNWMCNPGQEWGVGSCNSVEVVDHISSDVKGWRPLSAKAPILYCLCEKLSNERCKLQSSLPIMAIVIGFITIMVTVMALVVFRDDEKPLLTIGDAIVSFLQDPDHWTRNMCLYSREDFQKWRNRESPRKTRPRIHAVDRRRLFAAASVSRWIIYVFLHVVALSATAYAMSCALKTRGNNFDWSTIRGLGFGNANDLTFVSPAKRPAGFMMHVFVANLFQTLLSFLYFSYNGLFTSMAACLEWQSHGQAQKSLRVSAKPRGKQRESHFLQLPYRYAVPLTAFSALLHWLVSQSIFLVSMHTYGYSPETKSWVQLVSTPEFPRTFTGVAYSPLATICAFLLGFFLLVGLLWAASIRLKSATPVVGTCSAAIAAACHVEEGESGSQVALMKIQWGVTRDATEEGHAGHCAFSANAVSVPAQGVLYQ